MLPFVVMAICLHARQTKAAVDSAKAQQQMAATQQAEYQLLLEEALSALRPQKLKPNGSGTSLPEPSETETQLNVS